MVVSFECFFEIVKFNILKDNFIFRFQKLYDT